ncbi:maleylpyruvate isomerase N-terminal domain-containing protein, partial [Rathayibacter tanaceti]|uniref:maleylpyruvate isomerase N-terminal domain-containing protein n=1 Tax=Rathayibacter tanaceti TaxID=1671680 RepID=UPI00191C68B9
MSTAALFESSAAALARLLEQVREEQWTQPGLGEWDVRGLAGHASRAVLTVETALLAPEPPARTIDDALDYYGALAGNLGDPAAVARRGAESGRLLGDT